MQKDYLTPEMVKKLLSNKDKEIKIEEAKLILDFLTKMANIVVANHVKCDLENLN